MATIDPVSQPPAVAWKQVANQKIEELVSASSGKPVKRVTEVQEATLYELQGSQLKVSNIGLSQKIFQAQRRKHGSDVSRWKYTFNASRRLLGPGRVE